LKGVGVPCNQVWYETREYCDYVTVWFSAGEACQEAAENRTGSGVRLCNMEERTITVHGILMPADWNDQGEVVAIVLATNEEKEFILEGRTRDFAPHVRKEVEMKGVVKKRHGEDVLLVTDFRVIEDMQAS